MSDPKKTWWSRLTGSLHRGEQSQSAPLPPVDEDGLLTAQDESADTQRPPGPITRWSRREQALHQLQDGYDKMVGLLDSVHRHMEVQQARTEQLVDAVRQLSAVSQDTPAHVRRLVDLMGSIGSQLETTNVRTMQLADAVGELPQSIQSQTDTLKSLNEQLGLSNETRVQVANSLSDLGKAVHILNQQGQTQSDQLRLLQVAAEQRDEKLSDALRMQGKRMLITVIVALVLALGGLALGGLAFYLRLGG
ncbi:MAG TPA: hypothetical protein VMZ31_08800 [Phycisphaerae bacterium]|nr:hypothetical protein [Phycisphaerae bacterium]